MTASFESKSNIRRNSRMILGAAIVLALIFCINALFSIFLLRQNNIQNHEDELSSLTMILAEHSSQTIYSANSALDSIMDVIRMEKIQNEDQFRNFSHKKNQYELLKEKTRSNPLLDVTTLVGSDGSVLNFSRSYPAPEINLSDRDYFQYLRDHDDRSTFYSNPVRNKGNGKWVFYLARRVNGENEKFLGVVLVGVSVEVFSTLYERIGKNMGEGVAITLYRQDKTLLTRWPLSDDLLGKVNKNPYIDQSLAAAKHGDGIIFASGSGFARANDKPVQRMISYRAVDGYPFIVGAVVPESIYLENWYANASGVFLATALSLIALAWGTYLFITTYRSSAQNEYLAHHDALTELPNRFLFSDRLQNAISSSKRQEECLSLLFIDLDNLKSINDEHSHKAGDAVLKEVASRMRACIRESDTVARFGGDEFVVILPGIGLEADATRVAEKIRQTLMRPIEFEGKLLATSASIGVAVYPIAGQNETDLIKHADMAMYEAKSAGKNLIKVFSAATLHSLVHDLS